MNKSLTLIKILTLVAVTLSVATKPVDGVEGKCSPIVLANGRPKFQRQGRLVRFRCFKGYEFVGRRYMTCFKGKWDFQREPSMSYPMCVKPGCRASSYVNGHFLETYKGAVVSVVCSLGYTLVGPQTVYCNGYKWNQNFPECKATDKTPPKSCDFEKDWCGWVQDPHGDWLWQKGASQESEGPPYENGNLGHYILLGNSSSRIMNATERLFSPVFPPEYSTNSCFSFWYLLHGKTAGHLKVFVKQEGSEFYNTIPPFWVSGDQSPNWLPGYFRIFPTQVPFQIVIEGMSLAGNESRTAFDDVGILSGEDCEVAKAFYMSHLPPTSSTADPLDDDDGGSTCKNKCGAPPPRSAQEGAIKCSCHGSCVQQDSCCSDYYKLCLKEVSVASTEESSSVTWSRDISGTTSVAPPTSAIVVSVSNSTSVTNGSSEVRVPKQRLTTQYRNVTVVSKAVAAEVTPAKATTAAVTYRTGADGGPGPRLFGLKPRFGLQKTMKGTTLKSTTTTTTTSTPRRMTLRLNLHWQVDPSLSAHANKPRLDGRMPNEQIHRAAGEVPPLSMKSDGDHSSPTRSRVPAGTIEALVVIAAVLVGVIAMAVFIRRRRRKRMEKESMVEDSDVRFLTSDEFLDFTLARPADDDL